MDDVRCKFLKASGTACPHCSRILLSGPAIGASSVVKKLWETPLIVCLAILVRV